MCYNCGCYIPQDDMGHPDNITDDTLKKIGEKLGKSQKETQELVYSYLTGKKVEATEEKEINDMFGKASAAWGQSVEEAKRNTVDLLKDQLHK